MVLLESRMTDARIFGVFISKLSHQQQLGLITLFEIYTGSKIRLNRFILLIDLTIYLSMKSRRQLMVDVEKVREQEPEFRDK